MTTDDEILKEWSKIISDFNKGHWIEEGKKSIPQAAIRLYRLAFDAGRADVLCDKNRKAALEKLLSETRADERRKYEKKNYDKCGECGCEMNFHKLLHYDCLKCIKKEAYAKGKADAMKEHQECASKGCIREAALCFTCSNKEITIAERRGVDKGTSALSERLTKWCSGVVIEPKTGERLRIEIPVKEARKLGLMP